ncbi:hypothetical protein ACGFX8_36560 [Streptomyces sp. NPDC048362]|uniref:hypothetical protein n=1 Tax=Streptomyces sp. NPDC048362 TaxID=3365539 RepID=UPI00371F5EF0
MQEIYNAEGRAHAEKAATAFEKTYGAPQGRFKKITGEVEELLAFYDFPAEHWVRVFTSLCKR